MKYLSVCKQCANCGVYKAGNCKGLLRFHHRDCEKSYMEYEPGVAEKPKRGADGRRRNEKSLQKLPK